MDEMDELSFVPFDCDNHYYEAEDAFTRYVPKEWQRRCVQWCDIQGRKHHIVGGQISTAVANPTWDPIAKPGALHDYFRGNPTGRSPLEMLKDRERLPEEYMDRDARVKKISEQGLQGVWLFPTLGVLYEELLKEDVEAVKVLFRAFNKWVLEDWGCNYKDTIYAAPYITLCDVDFAVEELQTALDNGARVVCLRPAAVWTEDGPKSPADKMFDPFWSLLDEAGIPLVIHAGDSGYSSQGYADDGFGANFGSGPTYMPSIKAFNIERAALDWLMTMSLQKMYERFPNLRIVSVENGSSFLPDLFRKLPQQKNKLMGWFKEDPLELFKKHVWINPFWEDDPYEVAEIMGTDRVVFGSDWPHIEGMPTPLDYVVELKDFSKEDQKKILLDNIISLNEPNIR
ncbi:MAG: amidohydrolase family protein [Acidimicrobiales bacterium]|jgi:predicted TIM-barrel fold metal-dependent hydrolase|nr:amidohydrolase family protein [Acidimicrobiales bacterium]MDP6298016.1 amidohydrolase family protein [Acidimicrobiales bacterium]HJM28469.1 amidohydrolase family protein [Acidimicrobiales bacterium]HJM98223.1 amidohydrolase family protein [Acidimicrobiales bacterium]